MKLSEWTVDILKSFSGINSSIRLTPGKRLSTINATETVIAVAEIPEEFEENHAIYQLPQFINVLGLFDGECEMDFRPEYVAISGSGKKLRYGFCNEALISLPPEENVEFPTDDMVEFELPNNTLKSIKKAISMLTLPSIAFIGEDGIIKISTDGETEDDNFFSIDIGETNKSFKFITKPECLSFFPGDYKVRISMEGIAEFVMKNIHTGQRITYWVIAEKESAFD